MKPGSKAEQYHFIGKDILYFHTLFWPAMLEFSGHRTPTNVFAHGFLTVDGAKMSKSRGTFITAQSVIDTGINPEWLRYYFAAKLNSTMEDIDLNLEDFQARVNSDLVGKYVNIASRAAGFLIKRFDGRVQDSAMHHPLVTQLRTAIPQIAALLRIARIRPRAAHDDGTRRRRQRLRRYREAVGSGEGPGEFRRAA